MNCVQKYFLIFSSLFVITCFTGNALAAQAYLSYVFDDCPSTNMIGIDILHEHNQRGVLAVFTDGIRSNSLTSLTWADLYDAQNGGSEIVSHTITHSRLTKIPQTLNEESLTNWQKVIGYDRIYKTEYLYEDLGVVIENEVRLIKKWSIPEVESNAGSFFFDPQNHSLFVHSIISGDRPGTVLAGSAQREMRDSKSILISKGIDVSVFVPPGNLWNNSLVTLSQLYYEGVATSFHGSWYNTIPPEYPFWLARRGIRNWMSVEDVQNWILEAEQNGLWLILTFHGLGEPGIDPGWPEGIWALEKFQELVEWVNTRDVLVVTLSEGLNLACQGDFDQDYDVDGSDLNVFVSEFGQTDCTDCLADFDEDGDVYGSDLTIFSKHFGRTDCPVTVPITDNL